MSTELSLSIPTLFLPAAIFLGMTTLISILSNNAHHQITAMKILHAAVCIPCTSLHDLDTFSSKAAQFEAYKIMSRWSQTSHQAQSATGHEPWHTKRGGCGNAFVAWSQQSGCLWDCFKSNRSQQTTPKRNGKQRCLKSLPTKGERTVLQLIFWNAFFLISCCVSDYEMIDWSRRENPWMWREVMKRCQGMGQDKNLQLFL